MVSLFCRSGFNIETHIVAGMDEMKRPSNTSLVDLGLELIKKSGWATDGKLTCLQDIFFLTASQGQNGESTKLVEEILCWSTQPNANLGWLLGIALAFLELKNAIAKAPGYLIQESCLVLEAIVAREQQSLEECVHELHSEGGEQYKKLIRGYQFGRKALEDCLY
jgi:hypothetical protein